MHTLRSIQGALDRIEELLTEPIAIDALAREVGMSYWHFQRTFSAMVGESVGRYIRQRRVAHAARRLFDFEGTLLDLALEYQFESHEAFTRAFKSELSVTPSDWRDGRGAISFHRQKENLTQLTLVKRFQNMNLTPEIVTLPPRAFAGLQARFISAASPDADNMQVIPRLWQEFFAQLPSIPTNEPGAFYGLCQNLEIHGIERRHPDEALYLAAAQVAPDAAAPEGMAIWQSPGGAFAKFTHVGRVETISATMGYIYGKWFPESGYEQADWPDLERYDSRFDPQSDDSVLEIFIPIARA